MVNVAAAPRPAAAAVATLVRRWQRALAGRSVRVLLTDGDDARVVEAARRLADQTDIAPIRIANSGPRGSVEDAPPHCVAVWHPEDLAADPRIAEVLTESLLRRGRSAEELPAVATDSLYLGAAAVRAGLADACVGGATRPTGDVIRAGIRVVGSRPHVSAVTSSFLMVLSDGRVLAYGDCAVIPAPDPRQLADIALTTGQTYRDLTGREPIVAMLSFSTYGSAKHPHVERVRQATQLVRRSSPGLRVDGELQFDAAVVEAIGRSKARGSAVAGHANVLIFPSLEAGNIGYKITERLAGAAALGPILQGLAAPINDLSRGCDPADVFHIALLSAAQAIGTGSG